MMLIVKRAVCIAIFGVSFVFVGCDQGGESSGAPGASQLSPTSLAQLAAADAVDGEIDKVVSNCLLCGLGMPGDAQHTVAASDYKLHLCSDHCKQSFEQDPAQALATVKISKSE